MARFDPWGCSAQQGRTMRIKRQALGGPLIGGLAWSRLQRGCVQLFQRWAWGFLGAALGAAGVCWVASDTVSAHEQAQQAVDAALAQLQAQPTPPQPLVNPSTHAAAALWHRLTGHRLQDIWIDLQQALGAQGVQVVSIRVLPDASAGPLSSQSAALRVNAPYPEWVNAWRALSASGPVLSIERMSVVPQAQSRGVQMDVVLRRWFKTGQNEGSDPSAGPAGWAAVARSAVLPPSEADVFAQPGGDAALAAMTTGAHAPDSAALPADPLHWPLARIRLLGTWQQGVQWQAVLSAGGAWVPVRVGQRVSLEGHRVVAIARDAVRLRSAQGHQLELKWPGGAP
ncbi:MAG: GspMb/PilO family protein [Limnohabitans sp.]